MVSVSAEINTNKVILFPSRGTCFPTHPNIDPVLVPDSGLALAYSADLDLVELVRSTYVLSIDLGFALAALYRLVVKSTDSSLWEEVVVL